MMRNRSTRGRGDTQIGQIHRVIASPRHTLFMIGLLALALGSAHAINDDAGTSNGAFLKIPTDARGVALGPSMVSMAAGAEGMRWNPAALGMADSKEVSATHIAYYQDVSIENVTFAYPLEESAVAANLFYLSPGSLEGRDSFGAPTGDFDFYDLVASIGYGRRLRSRDEGAEIFGGAVIKVAQEKIAETTQQNPAADAGLIIIPRDNLRAGLALRNFSIGKADFPKEITGGASMTFLRDLTAGVAAVYSDDAPMRYNLAGEYRLPPDMYNAVVRLGYRSHDDLDDSEDSKIKFLRNASFAGLTFGTGFEYRPPNFKSLRLQLDYGLAPFGALGISHTLTLKVRW